MSTVRVSRILHAGTIFECEGTQIAFDPIFENPFSVNCHAFPGVTFDLEQIRELKFDAVFISHFHEDHCSFESLNLLDRKTPLYIYCVHDELFVLLRELGFQNTHSLDLDATVHLGEFAITPRRALDADVDSVFQIQAGGLRILNVVDSWIDPSTLDQLATLAPWDLVLWPFQTMLEIDVLTPSRATPPSRCLPPEWLEQIQILRPRFTVPSSCQFKLEEWSWINRAFFPISYRQFATEIQAALPETQVARMNPGTSFDLYRDHENQNGLTTLRAAPALSWMQPLGEQNVDYEFAPAENAPPTSEIAKNFAPLTSTQTQRALNFLNDELPQRLRALGEPNDLYFHRPRVWRVRLYHHDGSLTRFDYMLDRNDIQQIAEPAPGDDKSPLLAWTTDVPIAKLYAALEEGESLTSMYMRINDEVFTDEIENDIATVDVLEDPLVRCLFNGVFAAFQRAQLQRLQLVNKNTP